MQPLANPLIVNTTRWLLFINTFMAESVFRHRDYDDKSIDLQVILKLGVWMFSFLFCVYYYRLWARKLLQVDNFFQVILLAMIGVSCLYAPNFVYSAASAFSLIAILFMLLMASAVLTSKELIRQIIYGCSAVIFISIIVYFAAPDFGRMKEWVNGVLISSNRISGITGTANACGYIAAMALLGLYYYRQFLPKPDRIYWLLVAINLAGLFMSNSRTAMAALLVALLMGGLITAGPARLAALCMGVCLVMITAFTIDYDMLFSLLSRSGEVSEITSGTGRTEIWAYTIELIHQRPFFGWGYASSNSIIPAAADEIGFVANHTHNAFLQIALSIGYTGLFVFVVLIGLKIFYSFRSRVQLNIAFIFFLLVDGLTEPIAFQGPATTTTLVLATVLALNYSHNHETDPPAHKQRLSGSPVSG
ncbi:MAG: O-antigen ligase family protein [Alphaproteobacteria bacterium]